MPDPTGPVVLRDATVHAPPAGADPAPGAGAVARPVATVAVGPHRFDVRHRAVVVGLLPQPSGPAGGGGVERLLADAERLAAAGADVLEVTVASGAAGWPAVGRMPSGPAPTAPPSEAEERDRLAALVAALVTRVDVPVSVRSERASVLLAGLDAGALAGGGGGAADRRYLAAAAAARASVVVTPGGGVPMVAAPGDAAPRAGSARAGGATDRGRPGAGGPGSAVAEVRSALVEGAGRAVAAGIPAERVLVDAGLDATGLAAPRAVELLRASDRLAALGHPLVLSLAPAAPAPAGPGPDPAEHRAAALGAVALGVTLGCRVVRTGDVRGARRTAAVLAAVLAAAGEHGDDR